MVDRLVIRYYPVDGDITLAQEQSGAFGVSLWVQPDALSYDAGSPTMGVLSGSVNGSRVGAVEFQSPDGKHASAVFFDVFTLSEGDYLEKEVILLEPDSVTVHPVSRADLPLEVVIVGIGPVSTSNVPSVGEPWMADALAGGSYAGGVVQIGLFEDLDYTPLTTFWVDGEYFQPKPGGASWANPALPAQSGTLFVEPSDTYRMVRATLNTSDPIPAFWTSRVRTQEVI